MRKPAAFKSVDSIKLCGSTDYSGILSIAQLSTESQSSLCFHKDSCCLEDPFPHFANQHDITKTYLYNFDPLKPHFYTVKLGFTGVYIIFLISAQNIDCGYSLEPPRRGGSNEYPQSVLSRNMKNIRVFY